MAGPQPSPLIYLVQRRSTSTATMSARANPVKPEKPVATVARVGLTVSCTSAHVSNAELMPTPMARTVAHVKIDRRRGVRDIVWSMSGSLVALVNIAPTFLSAHATVEVGGSGVESEVANSAAGGCPPAAEATRCRPSTPARAGKTASSSRFEVVRVPLEHPANTAG